jgi:hypothetical protein
VLCPYQASSIPRLYSSDSFQLGSCLNFTTKEREVPDYLSKVPYLANLLKRICTQVSMLRVLLFLPLALCSAWEATGPLQSWAGSI